MFHFNYVFAIPVAHFIAYNHAIIKLVSRATENSYDIIKRDHVNTRVAGFSDSSRD